MSAAAFAAMLANPFFPIARDGKIGGKTAFHWQMLGRRGAVTSTSVLNDVVEFGAASATIPLITAADALEIVSSSASDIAGGAGVRGVKVLYLDAAGVLTLSANIALNGTNAVAATGLTLNCTGLWAMFSSDMADETITAVGNIRLRKVAGAIECEQISAGGNMSQSARIRVPPGYAAYLNEWNALATANTQDVRLRAQCEPFSRTLCTPYLFQSTMGLAAGATLGARLPHLKVPAGAHIKISTYAGHTSTARCDVDCSITLMQV